MFTTEAIFCFWIPVAYMTAIILLAYGGRDYFDDQ